MKHLNAILVDDEESARDVLENLLLRFCPEVNLIAKCENLMQAVETIKKEQPQLVFLDIEMPNYAGFEIVKFFEEVNFKIIFVTAYDKYAVRAFEIAALDYLLKPIDIDRLKIAVARAKAEFSADNQNKSLPLLRKSMESQQISNIVITTKTQQHVVALKDIIAIEAQESYCLVHTVERNFLVSKNLKHFESLLEEMPRFIRTHKSWIINKDFLEFYSKSDFTITLKNGIEARLSKYKKAAFEELLLR